MEIYLANTYLVINLILATRVLNPRITQLSINVRSTVTTSCSRLQVLVCGVCGVSLPP